MDQARPIHLVFAERAQRIGFVLKDRIPRFHGWSPKHEPCNIFVHEDSNGSQIQFQRRSDVGCMIEFGSVNPAGTAGTRYGPETILKSEDIGSVSELIDNSTGLEPIDVDFHDLFSKTDSKSTKQSQGESTKITISAEEGIEGLGSISESVEQEVHAEFEEESGSSTTNTREGDESTIVPAGKAERIFEDRRRADSELEVTSHAKFTFILRAGQHDHRWNHGWKGHRGHDHCQWDTWQDFKDVIRGEAPDNIDLAHEFRQHPAHHYDLDVLFPLSGEVRYKVKFEGKIVKSYRVQGA